MLRVRIGSNRRRDLEKVALERSEPGDRVTVSALVRPEEGEERGIDEGELQQRFSAVDPLLDDIANDLGSITNLYQSSTDDPDALTRLEQLAAVREAAEGLAEVVPEERREALADSQYRSTRLEAVTSVSCWSGVSPIDPIVSSRVTTVYREGHVTTILILRACQAPTYYSMNVICRIDRFYRRIQYGGTRSMIKKIDTSRNDFSLDERVTW